KVTESGIETKSFKSAQIGAGSPEPAIEHSLASATFTEKPGTFPATLLVVMVHSTVSPSVKGEPEAAPAPSSGGFLTQDVLNVSALPAWIVKVRTGSDVAILIARAGSLYLAKTVMLAVSGASTNSSLRT